MWILVVFLVYLFILTAIAWISMHPPRIPLYLSPGTFGAAYEEFEIVSGDGTSLRAWWIEAENPRSVMVLTHGYIMNRAELTPEACLMAKEGVSCLLIDTRAHGKSRGKKTTMGFEEIGDVTAAAEYARSRSGGLPVGLMGSSMGAAASAMAAGENPALADFLVLDSAYCDFTSAALGWWRFLGGAVLEKVLYPTVLIAWPIAGFNPFRVKVSEKLARFEDKPVLFFHGDRDNLALPSEAQKNFDAVSGPKQMVWFGGCGHSEGRWEQSEKYRAELLAFLRSHGLCHPA